MGARRIAAGALLTSNRRAGRSRIDTFCNAGRSAPERQGPRRPDLGWAGRRLGACGGSSNKTTAGHSAATAPTAPTPAGTTTAAGAQHIRARSAHHRHLAATKGLHGPHGGSERPASLGPQLTVAQLTQRIDAACQTERSRQSSLARPSDFDTNAHAANAYLLKIQQLMAAEVSALHVNPPPSLRPRYVVFFGMKLRESLLYVLAANSARSGSHEYVSQYRAALDFVRHSVGPAARRLNLPGCAG